MTSEKQLRKAIDEVQFLDIHGLRERFAELYGAECVCPQSPQTIRNRIIYKLQELHYGGLCEADRHQLAAICAQRRTRVSTRVVSRRTLSPGVRLIRQWKGVNHEVLVVGENQFEYKGEFFKSLTAIADRISGKHWNGNLFFGVKNGRRKNSDTVCGVLPKVRGGRVGAGL